MQLRSNEEEQAGTPIINALRHMFTKQENFKYINYQCPCFPSSTT